MTRPLVIFLISLGLSLPAMPQSAPEPTLEKPLVVVAKAKTIAVAPISPPEKGAIRNRIQAIHDKDNLLKTNELKKDVQNWLEKNREKEHPWTWAFTEDYQHADLVITYGYEYKLLPSSTTTPASPFGPARTTQDGVAIVSLSVVDGQHPERVLYVKYFRNVDTHAVVRNGGGRALSELQQRVADEYAKKTEKNSAK